MYRHIYTSTSERYLLDKKIQEKVTAGVEDFMKKIELSLLHNAYPTINEKEINVQQYDDFEKLSYSFKDILIKERISRININQSKNDIFNLDEITSKKLLISLYEYYLREEMVEYTDFWGMDKIKTSNKEKIEENFRTFIRCNDNKKYIEKFDEEIEDAFKDYQLLKEVYIKRPTYFLLYRIRNNMLKEVKNKLYSEKHFKNIIKDINKKYRELYVKQYNREFFCKIDKFEEMKEDVLHHVEEEFLDNIKNGKVVDIGNELANNFKENIKKDEEYTNLINIYMGKIKINDGFDIIEERFQEFQQKYNELSIKYLDNRTKINQIWLKDDLNTFLLYCTAQYITESNDNSIEDISHDKMREIEENIIRHIEKGYLKKEKYDIFVKVKNIELEQKEKIKVSNITFIKGKQLKDNINEYLKHECSKFEKEFFKSEDENEEEIFAMIEGVEAYKRDYVSIEKSALEKLKDIINVIYFYNSREESKKCKLSDRILIIENNTDYRLITHSHAEGIFNIQLRSNDWLSNIFHKNDSQNLKRVLNSIDKYNKLNKDEAKNNELLIEANKKLLEEDNLYNLAREMSIFIAGTNIFKYDVKYFNLRFWLIEDYIEFFDNKLPYDDFITERFLSFYKRTINIIFSYSDIIDDNLIKDLQRWILKIFPNDYMYEEENKNG